MSDPDHYRIGIICALPVEYTASQLILDERHEPPLRIHQPDPNNYTLGKIGSHNVVIAVLPDGEYGTATAAAVGTHMIHSFSNIKTGLLVGIGGGVPGKADIRLGDVVVGAPKEGGSGVLQYDFGKVIQEEELRPARYMDQAPIILRTAVAGLRSRFDQGLQLRDKVEEILSSCKLSAFKKPVIDHLYRSNIVHAGPDCRSCEKSGLIERPLKRDDGPVVHYGLIASADFLMKNAELRDKLAQKHGMLCFEMEAAGLVNHFPCLTVRGICDYSDSHKSKEWQAYAALTAAVYVKQLLSLIEPSQLQEVHTIKDFSVPFGLPGAPILETFYGRRNDLLRLEELLPGPWKDRKHNGSHELSSRTSDDTENDCPRKSSILEERNDTRRTVVICGLGGMGKTQIVIEYAKRHSKNYTAILWLDGKDEASLQNSFVISFKRLKMAHPEAFHLSADLVEQKAAVAAVLQWLNLTYNDRWLLVFDNVDEPDILGVVDGLYDVRKYFPSTMHGHIIITTRCTLLRLGKQLALQKMTDMKDCLDILRATSMRPNIDKETKIEELLETFDGLPLALATAGSYLSQMPDSVEEYLQLYRTSWLELQEGTIGLPEHEGRTLNVTWQITADHVRAKDASAWKLLELWASFSNQDLWYELLSAGKDNESTWFKNVTKTKSSFGKHMRILRMYGLVDIQHEPAGYSIHKCLHDWLKAKLPDVRRQKLWDIALACVACSVPGSDLAMELPTENLLLQSRLLSHAEECSTVVDHQAYNIIRLSHLSKLGRLYCNSFRFQDAEKMLQQVLIGYESLLGFNNSDTLRVAYALSRVYCSLYKTTEAERLCKRILDAGLQSPDMNDLLSLRTELTLGDVYFLARRLVEAEAVLLSVRQTVVKRPDWTPSDEVRFLTLLGKVYIWQNRPVEAKPILRQALLIASDSLDPHDYWFLRCKECLIYSCIDTEDLEEAERLAIELHTCNRTKLGSQHVFSLQVASVLGELYTKLNRLDEASTILNQAYMDTKGGYGCDHPQTLATGDTLAVALLRKGELTRAENLLVDISARNDKVAGPDHDTSLEVAQNLGDVYKAQGRLDEARVLYNRAYQGFTKLFGVENVMAKGAYQRLHEITELETHHKDTGEQTSTDASILQEPISCFQERGNGSREEDAEVPLGPAQ